MEGPKDFIEVQTIKGHQDFITELKYMPKIDMIITCSMDGVLKMWSTAFKLKHQYSIVTTNMGSKTTGVRGFATTQQPSHLLLCWGFTSEIKVFEVGGHLGFEKMDKMEGHMGIVKHCVISSTSSFAMSVDEKNTIKIWDLADKVCIQTINLGHRHGFYSTVYALPFKDNFVVCSKSSLP